MKNAISYPKAKFSPIRYCIFFAVIFLPALSFAQTKGTVEVIKDPLIDTLIARHYQISKSIGSTGSAVSAANGGESSYGFRVQFFFGSNRQAAYSAQAKFMEEYPEYHTYITYIEPNFKVQAGDFRTRLEAQKLLKDLTGAFTSLFIISGRINPPKTDAPND